MHHHKVVILDFGGQYAHLIANRVRRLGVYSEIRDGGAKTEELKGYKGIILSGGPQNLSASDTLLCDKDIFSLGVPVLGICYGHQLMQYMLGGAVVRGKTKEYGMASLTVSSADGIFKNIKPSIRVWMSHGDTVKTLAPGFKEIAATLNCANSAAADSSRHFYGVQFHPEVTHTEEGVKILDNFLHICSVRRDWSTERFIREEIKAIKERVGSKKVFLLVSGGVDSAVCFALLKKALGKERVYGLLVDHGLMRKNEAADVRRILASAGFQNLHVVDKSRQFFDALNGVTEPEKKRKIIGDMFWRAKEEAAEELSLNPDEWIMGQGTIYPDTIETGGTKHAYVIKTHHNRVDLVQKMIKAGKVIEPLAQLYKDEVRDLGEKLGLPHQMVWRQPFPGPGLGVRILCADAKAAAPPPMQRIPEGVILPIKSVGVQGDERTYRHPFALFTEKRDWDELEKISTDITNRYSEVNRVILCIGGGAADRFYLKPCFVSPERVKLLQDVDDIVNRIMAESGKSFDIWQFPVVLAPVSNIRGKESIILRPIVSTDAMTANFARIGWDILSRITNAILEYNEIRHVFYDLTHKPPGTIEWE